MRSDRVLALIRAHVAGDHERFRDAALGLAAGDARLWGGAFGAEVRRLLGEAAPAALTTLPTTGRDDKEPLLEVRPVTLTRLDLVTTPAVADALAAVVEEHRHVAALAKNGLAPALKLLLAGPPGTGKTSAAGALADALGVPLVVARHAQMVTSYLGESAKNLDKVFAFAAANRCVLLLDEFDSFGRARGGGGGDAASGELHRLLNLLLQLLDRHGGPAVVAAATNLPDALDAALGRRFDATVRFELPTDEQRRELIRRTLGDADGPYAGSHAEVVRDCRNEKKRRVLELARKGG